MLSNIMFHRRDKDQLSYRIKYFTNFTNCLIFRRGRKSENLTLVILFLIIMNASFTFSQYLPVITNEQGDTIHYIWPIPDSALCIKDEIIVKFKANALHLNKLCYDYGGPAAFLENDYNPESDPEYIFKSELMSQEFPVDSLIANPALAMSVKQFGGFILY